MSKKNNSIILILLIFLVTAGIVLLLFDNSKIKITLDTGDFELYVGDSKKINVSINPDNNYVINWSSSNNDVATVDNDGNVKAIKSGNTNIEVSVDGVIKSVKLSVKDILINSIRFSNSELTKSVGENGKLVPIITPDNATNRDYSWSSSDNSIVTIDNNGSYNCLKPGNATITVKTNNNKSASINISVNNIEASKISLNKDKYSLSLNGTFKLLVTLEPNNVTNKNITWSSSDSNIVSVDNDGNIKGLKSGKATITATTSNNLKATCEVGVIDTSIKYTCSGTINRYGTKLSVNTSSGVTKFNWNLTHIKDATTIYKNTGTKEAINTSREEKVTKVDTNTNSYSNSTMAFEKASVTLTLMDGSTKNVTCSINNTLSYKFHLDQLYDSVYGYPKQILGADNSSRLCGIISNEENDRLQTLLNKVVDEAGRGTRAGVVEAGRFLAGAVDYYITYQGNSTANIRTNGLHFGTKNNSWGCRNSSGYINGMDCTGFMNWPFTVNNLSRARGTSNIVSARDHVNEIQVGDLLITRDTTPNSSGGCAHAGCYGHDEIIIGVTDKYIYTLTNGIRRMDKSNMPIADNPNKKAGNTNAYFFHYTYPSEGNVTSMWVQ